MLKLRPITDALGRQEPDRCETVIWQLSGGFQTL